jgi:hypothetical protein
MKGALKCLQRAAFAGRRLPSSSIGYRMAILIAE